MRNAESRYGRPDLENDVGLAKFSACCLFTREYVGSVALVHSSQELFIHGVANLSVIGKVKKRYSRLHRRRVVRKAKQKDKGMRMTSRELLWIISGL